MAIKGKNAREQAARRGGKRVECGRPAWNRIVSCPVGGPSNGRRVGTAHHKLARSRADRRVRRRRLFRARVPFIRVGIPHALERRGGCGMRAPRSRRLDGAPRPPRAPRPSEMRGRWRRGRGNRSFAGRVELGNGPRKRKAAEAHRRPQPRPSTRKPKAATLVPRDARSSGLRPPVGTVIAGRRGPR